MLQRLLIFIYLIFLFGGTFTKQIIPIDKQHNTDKDDHVHATSDYQQQQQVQSPNLSTTKSIDNTQFVLSGNGVEFETTTKKSQPVDSQSQILQSVFSNKKSFGDRLILNQLALSSECKVDIMKYCAKGDFRIISNLKVLQCVDDLDNSIYQYKYHMIHDVYFGDNAIIYCLKDINLLDECNHQMDVRGSGRLVICLYERLNNITEPSCRYFINQLQVIVFSDWRLTEYLADACMSDIRKLECGQLDDDDNEKISHEQASVISCLSENYGELAPQCRKEIFHLTEMQSDDYHLDRALYYACRDDREQLCSSVLNGNGRVYRCLYEEKFNLMMSSACRKEVHRRQKLVVANAKLDTPLIRGCKNEISEHKCSFDPDNNENRSSLVKLLLCLGETLKKGYHIQDVCRREMLVHRRMLMSDYALSLEITSECKTEMLQHYPALYQQGAGGAMDQPGGRMIHCLLNAARDEKSFSVTCLSNIKSLVRAVDPGSDIRADPLLETTCRSEIDTICSTTKTDEKYITICLLDNLKHIRMTEECEDRLMEVSYFMARDWRLTPRLLSTCRTDLESLCQLPLDWSMDTEISNVQVETYLSCLYQQKQQLNSECRSELKRLMRIRSQSIGLMPDIEDNCITDLATCKNPEVKGEEMKCLQQKYNQLEENCKTAVRKFTKMTMSDPTLDFPLMKACESMIQLFCPNVEGGNENDLLRCLIKQKNNQKMDYRCKARIEHHQIISLKDEAFLSQQFQKQCAQEMKEHCTGKTSKSAVVQCLARLMLQDVLKKENKLTEGCRDELKFELLQRSESINLDPSLAKACQNDIRDFCGSQNPGNAQILDCLKANRNKVSVPCFRRLNQREKLDVILPDNDYSLTTKCSSVIQKFCANEKKQNILSCLRRNANRDVMQNSCRSVLYHRLMILNSDARFNKALIEYCQNDIHKHCQDEVVDDDDDDDDNDGESNDNTDDDKNKLNEGEVKDRDMGGRIIGCLRSKYANKNVELESKCITELIDVIQTSKLDVQLDVKLYQKCKKILDVNCLGLDKEDCLKLLYQKNQMTDEECKQQVVRIINEGRADIQIDQDLTNACQADLLKYCNDIPIGSRKQLQCLLNVRNLVSNQCKMILSKREELWSSISSESNIINGIDFDLRKQISYSTSFLFAVILMISILMFMVGYIYRAHQEYHRIIDYKSLENNSNF